MTTPRRSKTLRSPWRLERRLNVSNWDEALALGLAILGSVIVSSLLILVTGVSVPAGLSALVQGAVGSRHAVLEAMVQATPLIFTGLAAAIAFRARVWNIGGEGQFFAGAMGTFWVAHTFGGLPAIIMVPAMLVGAIVAGGAWGSIAGYLKAKYDTNEIIVTVMLNFVILLVLSYMLSGPWRAPDTFYFQTVRLPDATFLPRFIASSRLHWGFVLALFVAALVYILLNKTPLGFEIRGLGVNHDAAAFKGINVSRITIIVMVISGAIAGLAGFSEIAGIHHRLQLDISTGYGFTGIIIALLGRLHPAGVVIAALAFGALINGSTNMQIATGIPAALVDVIQGVVLVFVLIAAVAVRYRVRRVAHDG